MTESEHDHILRAILQKFATKQRLDAQEKSHLGECEDCMRAVIFQATEKSSETVSLNGHAPKHEPPSPELLAALEQGKRVFAREFGYKFENANQQGGKEAAESV